MVGAVQAHPRERLEGCNGSGGARLLMRQSAALSLLVVCASFSASAQEGSGGLILRSVSFSTGYTSIKLPPVTLGGYLPSDVLSADLITSGGVDLGWSRV